MKINMDSPGEEAQIQIVPLIDVIFCILTFFILAALQLTRQQGIPLDLPRAKTSAVQMQDMLIVTIDPSGQTYVDKQVVDRKQLREKIQTYHQQKPLGLMVLRASQTAFYNDVIQVLDILRSVGGDRVALATDASSTPEAANQALPAGNLRPVPPQIPSGTPPFKTGLPKAPVSPNISPNISPNLAPNSGAPNTLNITPSSPIPLPPETGAPANPARSVNPAQPRTTDTPYNFPKLRTPTKP